MGKRFVHDKHGLLKLKKCSVIMGVNLHIVHISTGGMQWLRHYATSRKVVGSIPDEVIGVSSIHLILPAALWPWGGSTQPLTEMGTRNIFGG
jgi:hypothetical protein